MQKYKDTESATRYRKEQIRFIMANIEALRRVDKTGKHTKFITDMQKVDKYTPMQMSYIDGCYELTMKGLGFPSAGVKYDVRKRW